MSLPISKKKEFFLVWPNYSPLGPIGPIQSFRIFNFFKKNCVTFLYIKRVPNDYTIFFEKVQYPKRFNWAKCANWAKLRKFVFFLIDICVRICNKLLKKLLHENYLKKVKVKNFSNRAKMCIPHFFIQNLLNFGWVVILFNLKKIQIGRLLRFFLLITP